MTFLVISITLTCLGVGSIGGAIIFMNTHHKNKAIEAAPRRQQLSYQRREPSRVVSSRLSSTSAVRKNYVCEEEEVLPRRPYTPPPPPPRKNNKGYTEKPYVRPASGGRDVVRRECSTWVLVFWWVVTLFCWFTLILQALVEALR